MVAQARASMVAMTRHSESLAPYDDFPCPVSFTETPHASRLCRNHSAPSRRTSASVTWVSSLADRCIGRLSRAGPPLRRGRPRENRCRIPPSSGPFGSGAVPLPATSSHRHNRHLPLDFLTQDSGNCATARATVAATGLWRQRWLGLWRRRWLGR